MRKRVFWKRQLLIAIFLLTSLFMLCPAQAAEKGGTIIEAIQTEPTNLNTLKAARRPEMTVLPLMFEPLFTVNKKLEIEPLLVDSYRVSADGLTWTLKMKP